jgi:hypothetical protein
MLVLKTDVTVSLVAGIKKPLVNGKLVSMNSVILPLDVLILLSLVTTTTNVLLINVTMFLVPATQLL